MLGKGSPQPSARQEVTRVPYAGVEAKAAWREQQRTSARAHCRGCFQEAGAGQEVPLVKGILGGSWEDSWGSHTKEMPELERCQKSSNPGSDEVTKTQGASDFLKMTEVPCGRAGTSTQVSTLLPKILTQSTPTTPTVPQAFAALSPGGHWMGYDESLMDRAPSLSCCW